MLFAKCLVASWESTLEGLLSSMQILMSLQSITASKFLTTPREGAFMLFFDFQNLTRAFLTLLARILLILGALFSISDHNLNERFNYKLE